MTEYVQDPMHHQEREFVIECPGMLIELFRGNRHHGRVSQQNAGKKKTE